MYQNISEFLLKIQPFIEGLIDASHFLEKATKLKAIEFVFSHKDRRYNVHISSELIKIKLLNFGDN